MRKTAAAATTTIVLVAIIVIIIIYLFGPEVHFNRAATGATIATTLCNLQSHAVREKMDYAVMKLCYNSSVLALSA